MGPVFRLLNKFPGVVCFHLPVIFNQSKALHLITGMPVTFGSIFKAGKRAYTLDPYIKTRFGNDRDAASLPARLTDVPQIPGTDRTRVPLEKMKNVYYKARGWDARGIPKEKTLRALDIATRK